jgi:small-conductance mechanosensitive channel
MNWKQLAANPMVHRGAFALVGVLVVWLLVRVATAYVLRNVTDNRTRYRVRKGLSFLGYLSAALIIAVVFSERLAGLGVAFGVAGAGIAFSLKELIASVAGWVAISMGRVYAVGDRVQIGAVKGDVIDVGILRTTLMELGEWVNADLYTGRIVRVTNRNVFEAAIFNYSADFPFLWDEITVPVRYGSDWKYAREHMTAVLEEICHDYAKQSRDTWDKALKRYQLENARIEPMVTLAANDNWIEFTLRYIVDYRKRRITRDQIFTRLLEVVDASENRIRLASATFELTNLPRVDVQFGDSRGEIIPRFAP